MDLDRFLKKLHVGTKPGGRNGSTWLRMGSIVALCVEKGGELPIWGPWAHIQSSSCIPGPQRARPELGCAVFQELGLLPPPWKRPKQRTRTSCLPNILLSKWTLSRHTSRQNSVALLPRGCYSPGPMAQAPGRPLPYPCCALDPRLVRAPGLGGFWEGRCEAQVKTSSLSLSRNGVLLSCTQMRLYLAVYVDDVKLAGPATSVAAGRAMLGTHLNLKEPTPIGQ